MWLKKYKLLNIETSGRPAAHTEIFPIYTGEELASRFALARNDHIVISKVFWDNPTLAKCIVNHIDVKQIIAISIIRSR